MDIIRRGDRVHWLKSWVHNTTQFWVVARRYNPKHNQHRLELSSKRRWKSKNNIVAVVLLKGSGIRKVRCLEQS